MTLHPDPHIRLGQLLAELARIVNTKKETKE